MRRFAFIASSIACLFVSARANATAEFPGIIVTHFAITCTDGGTKTPDCIICHSSDNGGLGTVTRPFGQWMKSHGLTPFADGELNALLDQAATNNVDSNCDGLVDTDQLKSCDWAALETLQTTCGTSAPDAGVPITVLYGCSTSPTVAQANGESPAIPAYAALGITGMLVGLLAFKRTRRKRA